jgi:tetratricopeptide (TPR) repeat protein
VYLLSGQADKVLDIGRKLLEIDPDFHGAYWQIGFVHLSMKEHPEALASFQKSFALAPFPNLLSHIGGVYGDLSMFDEAATAAKQLVELRKQQPVAAYNIARVYSRMGDLDKAFEWLEVSLEENDGELVFLNAEVTPGELGTLGTAIRTDPRFESVLRRVGAPSRKN